MSRLRHIVTCLLICASALSHAQILPGILAGGSAPFVPTITQAQAWGAFVNGASVSSLNFTYGSVPTAGNLMVCFAHDRNAPTKTVAMSDNMTDGGSWIITVTINANNIIEYLAYKVVGATANSGKQITATYSASVAAAALDCAEYTASAGTTWAQDGTFRTGNNTTGQPVTSASIGNTDPSSLCIGSAASVQGTPTPSAPLVTKASNFSDRALNVAASIGSTNVTPTWTGISPGTAAWNALGACWKHT